MPLFEYKCKNCKTTFQVLKNVDKRDETERCPKCGSTETERLISLFVNNSTSCNPYFYSGG